MRSIALLGVCVLAAACSGQTLDSPTSPTAATVAQAQTQAQSGAQLPFRGSFTAVDKGVVAPPNLLVEGTAEGNATQLGRFTATYAAVAVLEIPVATGTYDFTAANGDQLFTTFAGDAVDIEPGVASFTEIATIVGGTGRFAEATGTFTIRRIGIIDFAAATSTSSGSFEGHINLNK